MVETSIVGHVTAIKKTERNVANGRRNEYTFVIRLLEVGELLEFLQ